MGKDCKSSPGALNKGDANQRERELLCPKNADDIMSQSAGEVYLCVSQKK